MQYCEAHGRESGDSRSCSQEMILNITEFLIPLCLSDTYGL
jgi:hypothetical protein